ncbi:hypothetical protein CL619_04180 [archaeon]|nr:hypothetical protein [archaeon]|tara:strand:+ start:2315 stop:2749 length:435 start_codon:yes stop_codon:yes gene_type:complete
MQGEDIFHIKKDFRAVTAKIQTMAENYRSFYVSEIRNYADQLKDIEAFLSGKSNLPFDIVSSSEQDQIEEKVRRYEYGKIIVPSWLSPEVVLNKRKGHELLGYYIRIQCSLSAILRTGDITPKVKGILTTAQAPDYIQKYFINS